MIFSEYIALINNGWKMRDIDEMDIIAYLKLMAWKNRREKIKDQPRRKYIDEVWDL